MCTLRVGLVKNCFHSSLVLLFLSLMVTLPAQQVQAGSETTVSKRPRLIDSTTFLPFSFERNQGQTDPRVTFLARNGGIRIYLTPTEVVFNLPEVTTPVRMLFGGANRAPQVMGEEPLIARTNYFVGGDPSRWNRNITHYGKVRYRELYPGIDLVFYEKDGLLEYDFIVAPGADPGRIRLEFTGTDQISMNENDQVVLQVGGDSMIQQIPATYQDVQGQRQTVETRQFLDDSGGIGFTLSDYLPEHTLVIDPVMSFARFFGGSGEDEIKLTTDRHGNIFITGSSSTPDLPVSENSLDYPESMFEVEGNRLAFVGKFDPTGSQLIFLTYLGGSKISTAHGIHVDSEGNVYLAGRTEADDFPVRNALQTHFAGGTDDIFLSKLNPDGTSLIFSTYIGGSGYEFARAMALDSSGSIYLSGEVTSRDFPVMNPIISQFSSENDEQDIFVTKVSPDGARIVYSTYLGGSKNDLGHDLKVDAEGNAYVTGLSNSSDFPTNPGAFQPAFRGGEGDDAIVVKINLAGTGFVYSTFIGGTGDDESRGIVIDNSGNAIITGYTRSRDYPTMNAMQSGFAGGTHDIIVTSLNAQGSGLRYSTYLGGSGNDFGRGIALDQAGNVYLTGFTTSTQDFPLQQPLQERYAGGDADAFIMKLDPMGRRLLYSSYHGGSAYERGRDMTVDAFGNILISGHTVSQDFPVKPGSPGYGGGPADAYILKLAPE